MSYGLVPDPRLDRRPAAAAPLPAALQVELPIPCVRCGYELTGLKTSDTCPECATPIADSVRGDRLTFAPPAYLRSLLIGARLAQVGVLAIVAAIVLTWLPGVIIGPFMMGPPPPIVFAIMSAIAVGVPLLAMCVWLAGWWLLSPSPVTLLTGTPEHRARRAVRVLIIAAATCMFALFGLGFFMRITAMPAPIYTLLMSAAGYSLPPSILALLFAGERYLRHLRRRAAMTQGENRLHIHRWLWGVLAFVVGLAMMALLVGGVVSVFLFALLALPVLIALLITHAAVMSSVITDVRLARVTRDR